MTSKKKKKIKTKQEAIQFLNDLIEQLEESKFFASAKDFAFLQISQNNLRAMINSINHSEDFYDAIFKDKTEKDIQKWIENEAKEW